MDKKKNKMKLEIEVDKDIYYFLHQTEDINGFLWLIIEDHLRSEFKEAKKRLKLWLRLKEEAKEK